MKKQWVFMKVAHNNTRSHETTAEKLEEAKRFEADDDLDNAQTVYQRVIRSDPHNETAYNRLMIIYRKKKEFTKELEIVEKGIQAFEEKYAATLKTVKSKKVSNLSQAFLKASGLADKKGKPVYLPEPLAKWSRRKDSSKKS